MSGLRYNTGKLKWSLVDYPSLEPLVKVLEFGAEKYSKFELFEIPIIERIINEKFWIVNTSPIFAKRIYYY